TSPANGASDGVETREVTYVDTTRITRRNGAFPGAPSRTLRTRFYMPAERARAPFPLVVFSHGNNAEPEDYEALLRAVARAGYLVAAPAFPLTYHGAPGGGTIADLAEQPGDVSFVIDQVLAANTGQSWLRGLVDPRRIAVGGHSLGGLTTYGVAYNT